MVELDCSCSGHSNAKKKLSIKGEDVREYYDKVVGLIDSAFNINTVPTRLPIPCQVSDPLTKDVLLSIQDITQVIELDSKTFLRLLEPSDGDVTAFYNIENGIIFLDKEKWCINTLTHETLHSRSVFTKKPFSTNLEFVIEGLTELFAGFTFQRTLTECYTDWQTIDQCFHNNYEEYVKPWHYLHYKFDFLSIEQLFFNQNIQDPLKQLGVILENNGCKGCVKLFSSYSKHRISFFQDFKDLIGRSFTSEFADFMRTDLRETIKLKEL